MDRNVDAKGLEHDDDGGPVLEGRDVGHDPNSNRLGRRTPARGRPRQVLAQVRMGRPRRGVAGLDRFRNSYVVCHNDRSDLMQVAFEAKGRLPVLGRLRVYARLFLSLSLSLFP